VEPRTSRAHWLAAWAAAGLAPADDGTYDGLLRCYAEPHRAYHNLTHLQECLAWFDRAEALAHHPGEVQIALWFHDAIYDPRSDRNEEASADRAAAAVRAAGGEAACVDRIRELVLATRHLTPPPPDDPSLVADIDLAILGAEPERFWSYEAGIRQEYDWVPEAAFRDGRRKILERFLGRPRLYATDWFRDRLEDRARDNLRAAIARLTG
jgi:predicted metal-dependent HD superfamily phosphohydrolase